MREKYEIAQRLSIYTNYNASEWLWTVVTCHYLPLGCQTQQLAKSIQPDILSPPSLRMTSRKPLWLDLQPVDIKSRWRHNWKSAQVVNSHLVCEPTIQQSGFDLPRQQWSLLNRFRMEQGHCGACRVQKEMVTDRHLSVSLWQDPDDVPKLNGGLSRLHSVDEDAVSWLTSYCSWNAYKKKTVY